MKNWLLPPPPINLLPIVASENIGNHICKQYSPLSSSVRASWKTWYYWANSQNCSWDLFRKTRFCTLFLEFFFAKNRFGLKYKVFTSHDYHRREVSAKVVYWAPNFTGCGLRIVECVKSVKRLSIHQSLLLTCKVLRRKIGVWDVFT